MGGAQGVSIIGTSNSNEKVVREVLSLFQSLYQDQCTEIFLPEPMPECEICDFSFIPEVFWHPLGFLNSVSAFREGQNLTVSPVLAKTSNFTCKLICWMVNTHPVKPTYSPNWTKINQLVSPYKGILMMANYEMHWTDEYFRDFYHHITSCLYKLATTLWHWQGGRSSTTWESGRTIKRHSDQQFEELLKMVNAYIKQVKKQDQNSVLLQ